MPRNFAASIARNWGRSAMFCRRTFLSAAAASIAVPHTGSAQTTHMKAALYANVGADLTHYDVDVDGRRADQARNRHAARGRAVRLAACLAALSLRRDQQQRFRLRPRGDRASRHRVSHRSRERRADAARRADTAADAPDPHDHGHPVGESSWSRSTIRARCASIASTRISRRARK